MMRTSVEFGDPQLPTNDSSPARNATRAPIDRPVRLQFADGDEIVEARSRNVSIGGMFITDAPAQERGSQVKFELVLDESTSIRGLAEVVWSQSAGGGSRDAGLGLKFRFLEQRDRQQIFKLVSQHIKDRLAREGPRLSEPSLFESASEAPLAPGPEAPASAVPAFEPPPRQPESAPPPDAQRTDAPDVVSPPERLPIAAEPPEDSEDGLSDPWTTTEPARRRIPAFRGGIVAALAAALLAGGAALWWGSGSEDTGLAPQTQADVPPGSRADPPASDSASEESGERPSGSAAAPEVAEEGTSPPAAGPSPDPAPVAAAPPASQTPPRVAPLPPPPAASPPPASAPPPAATPSRPSSRAAFSELRDLRWRSDAPDLVMVLETDGPVEEGRFRYFRIDGEKPREVVRLIGVVTPYSGPAAMPENGAVSGIRFGYHEKRAGNELHVVLDMASPEWRVVEARAVGNRLEIVLQP